MRLEPIRAGLIRGKGKGFMDTCTHCGASVVDADRFTHERPDGRACRKAAAARAPALLAELGCKPGDGAPNLDAATEDQLGRAWYVFQNDPQIARLMFPGRPAGYRRATELLAAYAINRKCAVRARLAGKIVTAEGYELICERIYKSLPSFARW